MKQKDFQEQLSKAMEVTEISRSQSVSDQSIELVSKLAYQVEKINHPVSPKGRVQAINAARQIILSLIEFVDRNSLTTDPTYDRAALTDLIDEFSRVERMVGKETWSGLLGIQTQFRSDQDLTYDLLKDEIVDYLRSIFQSFHRWIYDFQDSSAWQDTYETLLSELSNRW